MNNDIDCLKRRLLSAVDFDQKQITDIDTVLQVVNDLGRFHMTITTISSTKIARFINQIRHFESTPVHAKKLMKNLIRIWNNELININDDKSEKNDTIVKNSPIHKKSVSTNDLNHVNGVKNQKRKIGEMDCKLNEPPRKLQMLNNRSPAVSESGYNSRSVKSNNEKNQKFYNSKVKAEPKSPNITYTSNCKNNIKLETTHKKYTQSPLINDSDSCPPNFRTNSSNDINLKVFKEEHKQIPNSPLVSNSVSVGIKHSKNGRGMTHFPDVNAIFNMNNDKTSNSHTKRNSSQVKDRKSLKRKESSSNGVVASKLPKVKSTKELLEEMGAFVAIDTKNKILGNEIIREDDTPKSCLPESVRPRSKMVKPIKTEPVQHKPAKISKSESQLLKNKESNIKPIENVEKTIQKDLKLENVTELTPLPIKKKRTTKAKQIKSEIQKPEISNNLIKQTNIQQSEKTDISEKPEDPLKFTIKAPKKKRNKHSHSDPPITNHMNDIPIIKDENESEIDITLFQYEIKPKIDVNIDYSERLKFSLQLAETDWVHHNCTEHPKTKEIIPHYQSYYIDDLVIMPWTDNTYNPNIYFPVSIETADLTEEYIDELIQNMN